MVFENIVRFIGNKGGVKIESFGDELVPIIQYLLNIPFHKRGFMCLKIERKKCIF